MPNALPFASSPSPYSKMILLRFSVLLWIYSISKGPDALTYKSFGAITKIVPINTSVIIKTLIFFLPIYYLSFYKISGLMTYFKL